MNGRVDKSFLLGTQWLGILDMQPLELHHLGIVEPGRVGDLARTHLGDGFANRFQVCQASENQAFFLGVIHRHPGIGRRDAQASFHLHRHTRSVEPRHTTVFKGDPGIAHIFGRPNHTHAGSDDILHRRFHQSQNNVDVVDHHVQHHAHIDGTERQRANANGLNKAGGKVQFRHSADGRVETFGVADL